jgi:hypothetical protein
MKHTAFIMATTTSRSEMPEARRANEASDTSWNNVRLEVGKISPVAGTAKARCRQSLD